jgi:hypothetical protein
MQNYKKNVRLGLFLLAEFLNRKIIKSYRRNNMQFICLENHWYYFLLLAGL